MAFEIAQFLFSEILRCPWCIAHMTGNVMEDMVMMFFLPTIISILFIYVLISDLKIIRSAMMKLLLGVGVYLFIVFGGFFEIVAQITKTYFLILIFLLGVFYFVVGHFLRSGEKLDFGSIYRGGPAGSEAGSSSNFQKQMKDDYRKQIKLARNQLKLLDRQIHDLENQLKNIPANDISRSQVVMQLNNLKSQRDRLKWDIEHRMKYRGQTV